MNDMKCPICGGDIQYNSSYSTYDCKNNPAEHYASEELWQELIRTRKALDVAKDKLDTVRQYHRGTAVIRPDDIATYCDKALEQITETNDTKAV